MDTPNTPENTATPGLVVPPKPLVHKNASWSAIISIIIILAMVIIGAFYAWGQRISEERAAQSQERSSNSSANQ
jgi:hypothetical protein